MKRMYVTRTHRQELELKFTWKSIEGGGARWISQVLLRVTKKEKNKQKNEQIGGFSVTDQSKNYREIEIKQNTTVCYPVPI